MAESDHNSESGSHISESEPEFSDADTVSQPDSLIKRAGITLTSRSTSNGAKNKTKPNDKTTNSRTERTAQPGPEARKRLHKKNGDDRDEQYNYVYSPLSRASSPLIEFMATPQHNNVSSRASSSRASSTRSSSHEHDEAECLSLYRQQKRTLEKIVNSLAEMKKTQNSIIEMIQNCDGPATKKKKPNIPNYVRIAVRDGYKSGTDVEYELQWIFSHANSERKQKYNSLCNERLSKHIETFVLGIYGHVDIGVIRAAIERYYLSMKETDQREVSGKTVTHKKKMAGVERRRRKMTRRKQALKKKTSYNEEEKAKVEKVLTLDFMSSEEEIESDEEEFFAVKRLTWRSPEADQYMRELDSKATQTQTSRGKRQRIRRVRAGEDSERLPPLSLEPSQNWALLNQN